MSAAASASRELPYYVQGFGGSSALLDLTATTVKNLPYAFFSTELHMNNLTNFITARVSYGECALRSVASSVYNFSIATVFTAMALATLGRNETIYTATLKYWMYTGLAVASVGVAIIGIVSTQTAAAITGGFLGATGGYAAVSADEDVGVMIRQLFKENRKKSSRCYLKGPTSEI